MESRAQSLINKIEEMEKSNAATLLARERINKTISRHEAEMEKYSEELDVTTKANEILRQVSDETVRSTYKFMVDSINSVLARIFTDTERRIDIVETMRGNYPQLEIELYVNGGIKRSLKDDSGHGIMQIISLLSNLCLIVVNGGRRIFVLDETLSGLSAKSRKMVDIILWTFTEIGFQFIVCEHGYIPKGAHVYNFKVSGDTAKIVKDYIADSGLYLNLEETNEESEAENTGEAGNVNLDILSL